MPGFCGYYRRDNTLIDTDINVQIGLTTTKEREIFLPKTYIKQYIIPKFENDKLFCDTDDVFYSTDGLILNSKELYNEYDVSVLSKLLPLMYKHDGINHINKLRGVFSGIIYDKVTQKIHLFTDHLGQKRLFYYWNSDTKDFIFASDLRIVTKIMQEFEYETILSEDGAYCLLTFGFMLGNKTLCTNVHHLEPGTILTLSLDTGEIQKNRYYELKSTPYIDDTEENIINELDKRFCKAIQREYDKDLEYGYNHVVTLSGGLDSRMTYVKGVMLGYNNIKTLTFSESGYLDEIIAEKISSDLGSDHIFHSLDNGTYLLNIEDPVKASDGLSPYASVGNGLPLVSSLNWSKLGLLHTGQIGDLILGSYLQGKRHHPVDNGMIKQMAYSSKLLYQLEDEISTIVKQYDTDEMCAFYERCVNGTYNGNFATQNYTEYASPFLDVDFIEYVMRVHPKYRHNNNLYAKWISKKTPIAGRYIWESTMTKVNTPKIVGLWKRAVRMLKRKLLNQRLVSMNPFDYWFTHNHSLRIFFEETYKSGIEYLSGHGMLKSDVEKFYLIATPLEKTQVLTLLEATRMLKLS